MSCAVKLVTNSVRKTLVGLANGKIDIEISGLALVLLDIFNTRFDLLEECRVAVLL